MVLFQPSLFSTSHDKLVFVHLCRERWSDPISATSRKQFLPIPHKKLAPQSGSLFPVPRTCTFELSRVKALAVSSSFSAPFLDSVNLEA